MLSNHTRPVDGNLTGTIVDKVDEIMDLAPGDIEPAPEFRAEIRTDFISAPGKAQDKLLILLDTDKILRARNSSGDAAS